jgi:hypothetical protein
MVNPSSYYNAVAALMQPEARLVLTCNRAKRWQKR